MIQLRHHWQISGRWAINFSQSTPAMSTSPESARGLLRHAVATLSYRAAKTLDGTAEDFAGFVPGPGSRTPGQILAHMADGLTHVGQIAYLRRLAGQPPVRGENFAKATIVAGAIGPTYTSRQAEFD
jgi:uncharacterized damage-inducible protein DinB